MRSSLTPLGNGIVIGLLLFIAGFVYLTITLMSQEQKEVTLEAIPNPIEIIKPKPKSISIGFVGDIIPHIPITSSAKVDSDNANYDYTMLFSEVSDILTRPTLLIGNLETPAHTGRPPSGYPLFNAPTELLTALKDAGFDALQIANNHSLDQGVRGLEDTIHNVSSAGMIPLGGTLYPAMEYEPMIQVYNDITVGIISATFSFNGFTLPEDKSYLANSLDEQKLVTSIRKAKDQGADIVIVMPHFGTEYSQAPNESQTTLSQNLINSGADAIVGTHPHVVQPVVEIETPSGDKALIAYSLGNFVSNQRDIYTDLELYLELTYVQDPRTKSVSLQSYTTIPLYMRRHKDDSGKNIFTVYPLDKALLLPDITSNETTRLQKYQEEFDSILSGVPVLN